jgi:ribosomal protein RSM22 (predicted rRNA methylase)
VAKNDWDKVDWDRLQRLRSLFLDPSSIEGPYWRDEEDLAHYDLTFATRIGWKWDAVIGEMLRRGWRPTSTQIYDWGCGTGIATRCVLAAFPEHPWENVTVWDHSPLATDFTRKRITEDHPDIQTRISPPDQLESGCIVLVSHTLGEASEEDLRVLWENVRKAQSLILVEPGTHKSSRAVIAVREALKNNFEVIAPCTHARKCGLLAEENSRHWCHHFGRVPTKAFKDANWAGFSRTMGIDLRNLPYSFLALEKTKSGSVSVKPSRILGRPRFYKGYCRILSCQASGVFEYDLPKRADKVLWKKMKKDRHTGLFEWDLQGHRIADGLEIKA